MRSSAVGFALFLGCSQPGADPLQPQPTARRLADARAHGSAFTGGGPLFEDYACPGEPTGETWTGDVVLSGDFDAIAFCLEYSRVDGYLWISGEAITDTDPLCCLQEVTGNLIVFDDTSLTELRLPNLERVGGTLSVLEPDLVDLELPALTTVGDELKLVGSDLLEAVELPVLETVEGDVWLSLDGMRGFSAPELWSVGGEFVFSRCNALQDVDLPALVEVHGLQLFGAARLEVLELPALEDIEHQLKLWWMWALTRVSLPQLRSVSEVSLEQVEVLSELELPRLASIGSLAMEHSSGPRVLRLPALTVIHGTLSLANNTSMTQLHMPELRDLSTLELRNNRGLARVTARPLRAVDGSITAMGGELEALVLPNLRSVGGSLHLSGEPLPNLDGLSRLESVAGDLELHSLTSLTNLDGLSLMRSVGGNLAIERCTSLPDADAWALVDTIGVDDIGGTISIEDNGG